MEWKFWKKLRKKEETPAQAVELEEGTKENKKKKFSIRFKLPLSLKKGVGDRDVGVGDSVGNKTSSTTDPSTTSIPSKTSKTSTTPTTSKKTTPVLLSPDCTSGEGRKKWSVVSVHFRVRLSEKKENFSVYDPSSKRWITWKKREKVKEKPLFPLLFEFAKKVEKERKAGAMHLFLKASCGACRVTVIPSMDKLQEKIKQEFFKNVSEAERSEVIAFVNSLSLTPYFLLTNDREVLERIEEKISSLPRPEPVLKELKEKVKNYVLVVDDVVSFLLSEVGKSEEVSLPQEIELKPKHALALLLALIVSGGGYYGYSLYKQKKEEEERQKMEMMRKQQWTPGLQFKREHLVYKLFTKEVEKLSKLLYSLTPEVVEAGINGNEVRIVYELQSPAPDSVRRGEVYRVEKKETVSSSSVSWESLRKKPAFSLPKASFLYQHLPSSLKNSIVEVKQESVDGVSLLCFRIDYQGKLTGKDIEKFLISLPPTTKLDTVQLTKREDFYSLTVRGEICGENL